MRCYICNSILEDPQFNLDHGDIDPCPHCLSIIEDVFGYADQPAAGEDDLPDDPILEGLYPTTYDPFSEGDENSA